MLLIKEVTTNLAYPASSIVLTALQGDSCRALAVSFFDGESPWELPRDGDYFVQYTCANDSCGIFDTLPDGTKACSAEGNVLTVRFPETMCAVPGTTRAQITIFSGGEQISTFPVEIRVLAQVGQKSASGNYANLQKWLLSYVTEEPFLQAVVGALPSGDGVKY